MMALLLRMAERLGDAPKASRPQLLEPLESSVQARRIQLDEFKAQLHYEHVNKEVDRLTQELHQLQEQIHLIQEKIRGYKEALEAEEPPEPIDLVRVYKSAGLIFPKEVRKTINEAKVFHSQIIVDRQAFLQSEIDGLSSQVQDLTSKSKLKDDERSELLLVLKKEEAWPEYQELLSRTQQEYSELQYYLKLRDEYQRAELELMKADAEIDEQKKWLYADFIGRVKSRTFLQQTYGTLISQVYESKLQGALKIDGEGGRLKVDPTIKGSASQTLGGKPNVALMAFMLAIDCLWARSNQGLGFQGFDNFLVSGVDARQVPTILRIGAEMAEKYGFQLVCGVNYDNLGDEAIEEFDRAGYFALKLSDRDASGKLFGVEW